MPIRGVVLIDKDKGYKALMKRMAQARRKEITVGVHTEEGGAAHQGKTGATILDVATIHEFGLGDNPERSFIRDWVDDDRTRNEDLLRIAAREIYKGRQPVDRALDRVGLTMVGNIQARIRGGISPGLQPETVERKGSSTPLIDKAQLITSISHKVK